MARNRSAVIRGALAALLAAALLLTLQACGDVDRFKVALDERIVRLDSKHRLDLSRTGVAFMSLGSADKCAMGVFSIDFRSMAGSTPDMSFEAVTRNMSGVSNAVIQSPTSCVEVVGFSLPPGDYRIWGSKWFVDLGTQSDHIRSTLAIPVPFTVKAGEVAYLGSFQMVFVYGKNYLGKSVLSGGAYAVGNELQRDSERLRALRPELTGIPVNLQLPPDDKGGNGFPRIARGQDRP
jgi:hypothetical protein